MRLKLTVEDYQFLYQRLQAERESLQSKLASVIERIGTVRSLMTEAQMTGSGRPATEPVKAPKSAVRRKRRMSAETRKKMSEAARSRWQQRQAAVEIMPQEAQPQIDAMQPRPRRGNKKAATAPAETPEEPLS